MVLIIFGSRVFLACCRVLATAGQNINDLVKYSEAASNVDVRVNETREGDAAKTCTWMMTPTCLLFLVSLVCDPLVCQFLANCLKWRNVAPTAPDTLGQSIGRH